LYRYNVGFYRCHREITLVFLRVVLTVGAVLAWSASAKRLTISNQFVIATRLTFGVFTSVGWQLNTQLSTVVQVSLLIAMRLTMSFSKAGLCANVNSVDEFNSVDPQRLQAPGFINPLHLKRGVISWFSQSLISNVAAFVPLRRGSRRHQAALLPAGDLPARRDRHLRRRRHRAGRAGTFFLLFTSLRHEKLY
jgi:hypothetical protein